MEKRSIEDCSKEQLVRLVKMLFAITDQQYFALPATVELLNDKHEACVFNPHNALVDILYWSDSPHPAEATEPINFKSSLTLAIERIEKAGGTVIIAEEKEAQKQWEVYRRNCIVELQLGHWTRFPKTPPYCLPNCPHPYTCVDPYHPSVPK